MDDSQPNDESWLNEYEESCLAVVEKELEILNRRLEKEKEVSIKNIWNNFLDSAEHITQLYKDRQYNIHAPSSSCWAPFQTAAGNVTKLYKEACDGIRRSNDIAIHVGHQRRNKELSEFVRAKRYRYIRRDELLSFLSGKPLPALEHGRPQFHQSRSPRYHPPIATNVVEQQHNSEQAGNQSPGTDDLHTFKEALAMRPRVPELYTFMVSEIARHNKRPASPIDVNMDSPTLSKRPRYYE